MIRQAKLQDAAQVAEVHIQSWKETYKGLVKPFILDQLDIRQKQMLWYQVIQDPEQRVWVYEQEHEILGFANFHFDTHNHTAELRAIYLHAHIQRKGIGLELFQRGWEVAKLKKCNKIMVEVFNLNPARHFYEKIGGICIASEEASNYGDSLKILKYQIQVNI